MLLRLRGALTSYCGTIILPSVRFGVPIWTVKRLRTSLIRVLEEIQGKSNLDCPPLTGATKPSSELPEFDSMIWPVATTLLSIAIGTEIPNDINIFVSEKTSQEHSINETVALVCELVRREKESSEHERS